MNCNHYIVILHHSINILYKELFTTALTVAYLGAFFNKANSPK